MHKSFKVMSAFLAPVFLIACSATPKQPPAPPADQKVEDHGLYNDMFTYGQYAGCLSARRTADTPETEVEPAGDLPGTQEEYVEGWREGFNKCRLGLGPVVPPGGTYE